MSQESHPDNQPDVSRRNFLKGSLLVLAGASLGFAVAESKNRKQEEVREQPLSQEAENTSSEVTIEWLPDTVKRWSGLIEKYSAEYDVDANVPAIIMTIESGGDPMADSGVAKGLMQITLPRATDIAAKFLHEPRNRYDLHEPETAIEFGIANIRHLIDQFGKPEQGPSWDTTVGLVGAGYYAGEGGAMVYMDEGLAGIQDQGIYNYIRYVTTMWRERHDDKSFAYRYWHDQGNGRALIADAEVYKM